MHILLDVVDAHYLFLLRAKSVTSQNILSLRYKLQANRSHFVVVIMCVASARLCDIIIVVIFMCGNSTSCGRHEISTVVTSS